MATGFHSKDIRQVAKADAKTSCQVQGNKSSNGDDSTAVNYVQRGEPSAVFHCRTPDEQRITIRALKKILHAPADVRLAHKSQSNEF